MQLKSLDIPDVFLVSNSSFEDQRGLFSRIFCKKALSECLQHRDIIQMNLSLTYQKGAIRGMHFQYPPHSEMKIIRCIRGRVFDVAVDLRHGSDTFLKWVACELSPKENQAFIIPEGFAHGFQVLEEHSQLLYLHTAAYQPSAEGGIRYNDPRIQIDWPLEPTDLSERDNKHAFISPEFLGIIL